jgi:predicted nucleic acid-binding protein
MTTGAKALFVDANVLIYSTHTASPFHEAATKALRDTQEQGIERTISTQVLREFYGFATRPGEDGAIPDLALTMQSIQSFRRSFRVLDDDRYVSTRLFDDLVHHTHIGGRQIHDANIVATMLTYGVTHLLTNNPAHFTRFVDLITITPLVRAKDLS